MKLKHPNMEEIPDIRIYGSKIKFDRGPALAFNVFDWKGEKVEAPLIQKVADRSNISLSCRFLHHISFSYKYEEEKATVLERRTYGAKGRLTKKSKEKANMGIAVVKKEVGLIVLSYDKFKTLHFSSTVFLLLKCKCKVCYWD